MKNKGLVKRKPGRKKKQKPFKFFDMCMTCSGKSSAKSHSYTPKKMTSGVKTTSKKNFAGSSYASGKSNFGMPKVKMSFGKKY